MNKLTKEECEKALCDVEDLEGISCLVCRGNETDDTSSTLDIASDDLPF